MRVIGLLLRRAFPLAMLMLAASLLFALLGFGGAYVLGYAAAGLGILGGIAATLLPSLEVEEGGWLAALIEGFSGDGAGDGEGGGGDGGGGDGGGGD